MPKPGFKVRGTALNVSPWYVTPNNASLSGLPIAFFLIKKTKPNYFEHS